MIRYETVQRKITESTHISFNMLMIKIQYLTCMKANSGKSRPVSHISAHSITARLKGHLSLTTCVHRVIKCLSKKARSEKAFIIITRFKQLFFLCCRVLCKLFPVLFREQNIYCY